jgi:hypothetical protein
MNLDWIKKIIEDGATGNPSAKRVALIMATIALSAGTIVLCVAAYCGRDVALALAAVTGPLAGLAGHSYVGGKKAEAARDATEVTP